MSIAEWVYKAVILNLFLSVLVGGIADLILLLTHKPTITDWLRLNPNWYYYPMATTGILLAILLIHLFAMVINK